MKGIVPLVAIALGAWSGDAAAAVVWTCEVLHSYGLAAVGAHEPDAAGSYVGDRFTVNDDTGAVAGPHLGMMQEWTGVKRRFGADMDDLQSIRSADGRPLQHRYVETFTRRAAKPFVIADLDIGATRTGTCRAGG